MARPVLFICTSCKVPKHRTVDVDRAAGRGALLFEAVRAIRKQRGVQDVFKVEEVRCLGMCDEPCNVELKGKRRSTCARTRLSALTDAAAVVDMACAYAALSPAEELPERGLPGDHAD